MSKKEKDKKLEKEELNGIINGHNKKYTFSQKTKDFGEYLKSLNIKPFDKVIIINNILFKYNIQYKI